MSPANRRYKVTKPGKVDSKKVKLSDGATEPSPKRVSSGGRKYKVITPGKIDRKEEVKPKPPQKRPGAGSPRRYKIITPGKHPSPEPKQPTPSPMERQKIHQKARPVSAIPSRQIKAGTIKAKRYRVTKPRQPASDVRRVPAESDMLKGQEDRAVLRTGKRKEPRKAEKIPAESDKESIVLNSLDKGPANLQILVKRTNLPQTTILPLLKSLMQQKLVRSKKFGRVTKYKLSSKGEDLLHPRLISISFFGKKRKRRGRRRRISMKQRRRKYDIAIGVFIVAVIIVLAIALYFVYGIFEWAESEKDILEGEKGEDDVEPPIIVWSNPQEFFDNPSGNLRINLILTETDNPSGINPNKVKIQIGYASSSDLTTPDISGWTDIVANVNLPYVNVTLTENWRALNNDYVFVRCEAWDNAGNRAEETYKILIKMPV